MRISIDVKGYYDWAQLPVDAAEPTEADIKALRVKPSHMGGWLMKIKVAKPSHTDVSIPESQITEIMEHHERAGAPKRRGAVVAWFLEEKVMPHHSHVDDFEKISVHDEPEVEAFLNSYFEIGAV